MTSPKVSVVIPVYNAGDTIRKCLDSIISQTLTEWEAILVDDGSTDESGIICDEYVKQDLRIRVIHKENGGVSAARQTGLDATNGEYVIHTDPDDWVEPTMLEELFNKAEEEVADMVICDFFIDIGDQTSISRQRPVSLESTIILNNMFGTNTIHGSCCNKLVKKSCIESCQATFPDGINYLEDICFNVQLLKHNIKVSYLNKAFYHYVQHPISITNNYTLESLNMQKRFVSFLAAQLSEGSIPVSCSKEFVKKLAFRNSILSREELADLYPEIKNAHDSNLLVRWMYNLAFTNHYSLALFLRKAYFYLIKEK